MKPAFSRQKRLRLQCRTNDPKPGAAIAGHHSAFLFLENSGDDEVDPDSAVKAMENISHDLHALSHADQLKFRQALAGIAQRESEPWRTFVNGLADMIGLDA